MNQIKDCVVTSLIVPLIVFVATGIQCAGAREKSTLIVQSNPDSSSIFLDNAEEAEPEKTPYTNASMIPGKHEVLIVPQNALYKYASYDVSLEEGSERVLQHSFLYHDKALGLEYVSVPSGRMSVELGFLGLAKTGKGKSTYADAEGNSVVVDPVEYKENKRILSLPFTARLGLPYGNELHFTIPLSQRKDSSSSEAGFGMGDYSFGTKFSFPQIHSGLDVSYHGGVAAREQNGTEYRSLVITLLTAQSYKNIVGALNLGYGINFAPEADTLPVPGNDVLADLRLGYQFAYIQPFLHIDARMQFEDVTNDLGQANDELEIAARIGGVFELGAVDLELGVPYNVVNKNTETGWGVDLSVSTSFQLWKEKKVSTATPEASADQGKLITRKAGESSSFILFSSGEVTNAEYRKFCSQGNAPCPGDPGFADKPNYFKDPKYNDFPVVNVSFKDALAYAQWAGKRLPTKEEWIREFGDVKLKPSNLNCGSSSPVLAKGVPQINGISNVIGNVSEWVTLEKKSKTAPKMHIGGAFNLPVNKCSEGGSLLNISNGSGAKTIGFRVVSEIR